MRRITAGLFITVDGVVESPDQWQEGYFNEEMRNTPATGPTTPRRTALTT